MNTGDLHGCYDVATCTTPAGSSKKPKQKRQMHGFSGLLRGRNKADRGDIDGRSAIGRAVKEWRDALATDLGGDTALSAQQRLVLDMVTMDKMLIDSIETYLLSQKSVVNRRKKAAYPILLQLAQLKDSMTRRLIALGLERKGKPPVRLHDILSAPQANDRPAA